MPLVVCTQQNGTFDSFSVALPAGAAVGNVVVAVVAKAMDNSVAPGSPITTADAGWVKLAEATQLMAGEPGTTRVAVFIGVLGVGFSDPVTFDTDPGAAGGWAVNMARYIGVDTSNPVNAMNPSINLAVPGDPVMPSAPSITTNSAGCMLIYLLSIHNTLSNSPAPAGMTLRQGGGSSMLSNTLNAAVAIFDQLLGPAGATGARSQSLAAAPGFTATAQCFLLALQPICND